jgi:hypothetical protein
VWSDAITSPADFFFWASDQPQNYAGKENCLLLDTNTAWYDEYCYLGRRSLMKWNTSAVQLPEGELERCVERL